MAAPNTNLQQWARFATPHPTNQDLGILHTGSPTFRNWFQSLPLTQGQRTIITQRGHLARRRIVVTRHYLRTYSPAQIAGRASYLNALLIAFTGDARQPCTRCQGAQAAKHFVDCLYIPGSYDNVCANCKHGDQGNKCTHHSSRNNPVVAGPRTAVPNVPAPAPPALPVPPVQQQQPPPQQPQQPPQPQQQQQGPPPPYPGLTWTGRQQHTMFQADARQLGFVPRPSSPAYRCPVIEPQVNTQQHHDWLTEGRRMWSARTGDARDRQPSHPAARQAAAEYERSMLVQASRERTFRLMQHFRLEFVEFLQARGIDPDQPGPNDPADL